VTAPTGIVALAFTDVQGSTARWEADPSGMHAALSLHNRVMRAQLAAHGGYEVKTEGDAFMVAFAEGGDAIRWCLAAQQALQHAEWPGGPDGRLRVRMGAHVGAPTCEPDPVTGRMDYFGPMVNRAARVGAASHGDQVVVTRALLDAAGALPEARVSALGLHRLRGLRAPARLAQVEAAGAPPQRFPALRTEASDREPLPAEPGPLLGRDAALQAVWAGWLAGARTLCLLGPGGVGKTRLALHVAHTVEREDAPDGGTWWVDLLPCRTAADVLAAVAGRLGVPLPPGGDADNRRDALVAGIAGREHVLVVLDNAEHVLDAVRAFVAAAERGAPRAWFLVTSRSPLRTPHERVVAVAALSVEAGVALLEARAARSTPGFRIPTADRPAAEALVRRLEGGPLALELAAARLGSLGVAGVLARLDGPGGPTLGGLVRDDGRSGSLEATLAWSWDLLDPAAQRALCALAVFGGGFRASDAEAVLGGGQAGALDVLVDHSLVETRHREEGVSLRLYRTVRSFAVARREGVLGAAQGAAVSRAHAAWAARFGALGRMWSAQTAEARALLLRLPRHRADVHAAWCWAREAGEGRLETELAVALGFLHLRFGPYEAGLPPVRLALERPVLTARDAVDLRLLLAHLLVRAGSAEEAEAVLLDGLSLAEGEDRARVLLSLTMARRMQGRIPDAESSLAEARAALPPDASASVVGNLENNAGILATHRSRPAEAEAHFLRALHRFSDAGLVREQGMVALNLGGELATRGQPVRAQRLVDQSVALAREAGDLRFLLFALGNAGLMAARHGDLDEAWERLLEAERRGRTVGDDMGAGTARLSQGSVLLRRGQVEAALDAMREARAHFERAGSAYWDATSSLDLALAMVAAGQADEAGPVVARAHTWFAASHDPAGVARMDWVEAVRLGALGDPGAAPAMRAARAACLAEQQAQEAVRAQVWLGCRAPTDEAEGLLRIALVEARTAQLHREAVQAGTALGVHLVGVGRLGEGMVVLRDAVELARSTHRRAVEAEARCALGAALLDDGAHAEAELELGDALGLAAALGLRPTLARVRLQQGRLALARGQVDDARLRLRRVQSDAQATGDPELSAAAAALLRSSSAPVA
jgi:predicted ATPase/class 3 adenylate cyclase